MSEELVRVERVSREFGHGRRVVRAVREVSFTAARGELVAIRGRSGAGKTTLLNLIGGLDRPSAGRVWVAGEEVSAASEQRVAMLLELVGLGGHAAHRPYELSGGQQQRVAIARALANEPELLIADEPTGQLDSETGRSIMELLRAVVRDRRVTALVATHDPALLDLADRVLTLRDGQLVDPVPTATGAGGGG